MQMILMIKINPTIIIIGQFFLTAVAVKVKAIENSKVTMVSTSLLK